MMKKILALVMILVIAASVAVTASAAGSDQVIIGKSWVASNGDAVSGYPDVELSFTVTEKKAKDNTYTAYGSTEDLPDLTFAKSASSSDITVSGADSIKGAGVFNYVITENDPNAAGVTANDDTFLVEITRLFKKDASDKATSEIETSYAVYTYNNGVKGDKLTAIKNIYESGDLSLDVAVEGNLSNKEDDFTVEITIVSDKPVESEVVLPDGTVIEFEEQDDGTYVGKATVTISDNDGEKTITNIPAGVTVTVEEKDPNPYELVDYEVDGEEKGKEAQTITMTSFGADVVITNERSTEIDTGISLDSLPYVLVLIAVAGVLAFFVIRKHRAMAEID